MRLKLGGASLFHAGASGDHVGKRSSVACEKESKSIGL